LSQESNSEENDEVIDGKIQSLTISDSSTQEGSSSLSPPASSE